MSNQSGTKRPRAEDSVHVESTTTNTSDNRVITIETMKRFSVAYARLNPHCLFVFGDNLHKIGKAGQAILRGQPNAMGVPTKRFPSFLETAFFSDKTLETNDVAITGAVEAIYQRVRVDRSITHLVFPADGLGTGLAQLAARAPETAKVLDKRIANLVERLAPTSCVQLTKCAKRE